MPTTVGISFRRNGKVYLFDPTGIELQLGDQVVAETANGTELGEVKIAPRDAPEDEISQPLKAIVRRANLEDIRRLNENKLKEQQAFRTALEKISFYNLPMKLVAVECAFDRTKMTFHFVAENRVDFRELAKDLARTVRCRVELHQIGVRDEAKLLGGLGPCGRELCCSSFLTEFEPVGIKMAKEQDLSLNPQKISGVCGRLMCCLSYEYTCYKHAKKRLPRMGARITTEKGPGKVTQVDVITEEITVTLEEGGFVRLKKDQIPEDALPAHACGGCPNGDHEDLDDDTLPDDLTEETS